MRRPLSSLLPRLALGAAAFFTGAAGCELLAPFDEGLLNEGGGGAGEASSSGKATTTAASGSVSASGSGGAGGQGATSSGSAGGGGVEECAPFTTAPCYGGPQGTEGVGICLGGTRTCDADGMGYGPCVGEVLPKGEDCSAPGDENCDGAATSCTGDYVSGAVFGDGEDQSALAVAADPFGDIFVTGVFRGNMTMGAFSLDANQKRDGFIAKIAPSGITLWAKHFGDMSQDDEGRGVATGGGGNVVITGFYRSTIEFGGGALPQSGGDQTFVVKLDADGNHVWSKGYGDSSDQAGEAVAIDSAGRIVVVGTMEGQVDFGGGPLINSGSASIFVLKLDATGNHLWSQRFGDGNAQAPTSVAFDSAGNILLTGQFQGKVDFGGGPLDSAGGDDVFLVKLDPDGNHLWSHPFGGSLTERGESVAVGPSDQVGLVGTFKSTIDFGQGSFVTGGGADIFFAVFDPSGATMLSKAFGGTSDQNAYAISFDAAGNALIAGSFRNALDLGGGPMTSAGVDDIFVAKLDPVGALLWGKSFGDGSSQVAYGAVVTSLGDAAVVGEVNGLVDFGGGLLTPGGANDAFVAFFGP